MTHDGVCFVLVWPPVKEACGVKRISFQGKTRLMEAPRAEPFLPDYIVQRLFRPFRPFFIFSKFFSGICPERVTLDNLV